MKVDSTIDKNNNVIYRKCSGNVKIEDIIDSVNSSFFEKSFKRNMNAIWDFRDAIIQIDKSDLSNRFYPVIKKLEKKRGTDYKIAIWILSVDNYIKSAVYQVLSELATMPFIISIFRYKDDIVKWLEIDPNSIDYF